MSATFWDKRAAKYAKSTIGDMDAYEYGLERAAAHLNTNMDVLEFGCGTGMTALKLAGHVGSYEATDFSAGMIAECKLRLRKTPVPNVTFRTATLEDASLASASYDAVLGFNILHLIDDVDGAIAHAYRLVKPGGIVITKTVCAPARQGLYFRFMMAMAWVYTKTQKGFSVRIEPVERLEKRFTDAGFDIIETGSFPKSPPSRFIVARKR